MKAMTLRQALRWFGRGELKMPVAAATGKSALVKAYERKKAAVARMQGLRKGGAR